MFSSLFSLCNMADTRRVVGGSAWARADAVSKDAKRIYGSKLNTTWLHGTVLEVKTEKKNAASKRATTYIKARYMCGNAEKEATLSVQVLKATEPTGAGVAIAPNPIVVREEEGMFLVVACAPVFNPVILISLLQKHYCSLQLQLLHALVSGKHYCSLQLQLLHALVSGFWIETRMRALDRGRDLASPVLHRLTMVVTG